jgi:glutamate--cysteine ligase
MLLTYAFRLTSNQDSSINLRRHFVYSLNNGTLSPPEVHLPESDHHAHMHARLAGAIRRNESALNDWFATKRSEFPTPIYASFDVRDSGFKCASVDANAFPCGFHNLDVDASQRAAQLFRSYIGRVHPAASHIHIYPENHTRNPAYLENVRSLLMILGSAGYRATAGSPFLNPLFSTSNESTQVYHHTTFLAGEGMYVQGMGKPDLVVLNNDLSCGVPRELSGNLCAPPSQMGWGKRKKTEHCAVLEKLCREIGQILETDPWLIMPFWSEVNCINISDDDSWERLCRSVDELIEIVRSGYINHGVTTAPRIFVKDNAGTYGLGVISVGSADELRRMSKRVRKKAFYSRNGVHASSFLLQESIPTHVHFNGYPAESVFYLIGGEIAGVFFRANSKGAPHTNLNTPSAIFVQGNQTLFQSENARQIQSLVARISCVAMGMEMGALSRR